MIRRERLEARLERRRQWMASRAQKARTTQDQAERMMDAIPFGQPILVGHHSERRDQNYRARIGNKLEKAAEHRDMARHHEQKADGLESQLDRSIFSDDPDAIEAIRARMVELEAEADERKRINAAFRKGKGAPGWADSLALPAALQKRISDTLRVCPWLKQPMDTTNIRANIRRLGERIKDIEHRAARAEQATAAGGVLISGNEYVNVTFSEKPDREILDALKAAGFAWGGGCWGGYRERLPECAKALAREEVPHHRL